jgi:hypothetical protein
MNPKSTDLSAFQIFSEHFEVGSSWALNVEALTTRAL